MGTTITLAVSLSVLALILLIVFTVVACRPSPWPFTGMPFMDGMQYRAKASKALTHKPFGLHRAMIRASSCNHGSSCSSMLLPTKSTEVVIEPPRVIEGVPSPRSDSGAGAVFQMGNQPGDCKGGRPRSSVGRWSRGWSIEGRASPERDGTSHGTAHRPGSSPTRAAPCCPALSLRVDVL